MGSANQYRRCISGDAGALNPFRYRGYTYDEETGLYYLRSRYYNPKLSRFINADDVEALGADGDINGYQLFNYCMNDPVNRRDEAGSWSLPNWAKVAIGAALIVGAAVVATVATGLLCLWRCDWCGERRGIGRDWRSHFRRNRKPNRDGKLGRRS